MKTSAHAIDTISPQPRTLFSGGWLFNDQVVITRRQFDDLGICWTLIGRVIGDTKSHIANTIQSKEIMQFGLHPYCGPDGREFEGCELLSYQPAGKVYPLTTHLGYQWAQMMQAVVRWRSLQ